MWLPALKCQHFYKTKLKSHSAVIKGGLSKHDEILVKFKNTSKAITANRLSAGLMWVASTGSGLDDLQDKR